MYKVTCSEASVACNHIALTTFSPSFLPLLLHLINNSFYLSKILQCVALLRVVIQGFALNLALKFVLIVN